MRTSGSKRYERQLSTDERRDESSLYYVKETHYRGDDLV